MLGEDIILWNDILTVFNDAMHVRHGDTVVEYLKDEKFEFLQPLRISAYPAASTNSHENQCPTTTVFINDNQLPTSVSVNIDSQTASTMQQPSYNESGLSSSPASGPLLHTPQIVPENEICSDNTDIQTNSTTDGITEGHLAEIASDTEGQTDIDMKAIYNQGLAHYDGKDIPLDFLKAKNYFLKAASHGYVEAQHKLGYMHRHGQGIPQGYSKAAEWFMLAAYQKCPESQCELGDLYYGGQGVAQSYSMAMSWYFKAAEQWYAVAQYNLGSMHFDGKPGPKESEKAIYWYQKADGQGYAEAQYKLGIIYMYVSNSWTSECRSKAFEWFIQAAFQGCARSQRSVGSMYRDGKACHKTIPTL
ncbi:hypothetical protein BGX26_012076 [Mortierella sp. AD094]|nr:hypothetical protein BGX26_012076 [Mortierella sp. AD094]